MTEEISELVGLHLQLARFHREYADRTMLENVREYHDRLANLLGYEAHRLATAKPEV